MSRTARTLSKKDKRRTKAGWRCGVEEADKYWQKPESFLILLLGEVVHDPRAEIVRLLGRRRLLDNGDLHEFTPLWLNGLAATLRNRRGGGPLRQAVQRRLHRSAVTGRRIHVT